eukprot:g11160.t1
MTDAEAAAHQLLLKNRAPEDEICVKEWRQPDSRPVGLVIGLTVAILTLVTAAVTVSVYGIEFERQSSPAVGARAAAGGAALGIYKNPRQDQGPPHRRRQSKDHPQLLLLKLDSFRQLMGMFPAMVKRKFSELRQGAASMGDATTSGSSAESSARISQLALLHDPSMEEKEVKGHSNDSDSDVEGVEVIGPRPGELQQGQHVQMDDSDGSWAARMGFCGRGRCRRRNYRDTKNFDRVTPVQNGEVDPLSSSSPAILHRREVANRGAVKALALPAQGAEAGLGAGASAGRAVDGSGKSTKDSRNISQDVEDRFGIMGEQDGDGHEFEDVDPERDSERRSRAQPRPAAAPVQPFSVVLKPTIVSSEEWVDKDKNGYPTAHMRATIRDMDVPLFFKHFMHKDSPTALYNVLYYVAEPMTFGFRDRPEDKAKGVTAPVREYKDESGRDVYEVRTWTTDPSSFKVASMEEVTKFTQWRDEKDGLWKFTIKRETTILESGVFFARFQTPFEVHNYFEGGEFFEQSEKNPGDVMPEMKKIFKVTEWYTINEQPRWPKIASAAFSQGGMLQGWEGSIKRFLKAIETVNRS